MHIEDVDVFIVSSIHFANDSGNTNDSKDNEGKKSVILMITNHMIQYSMNYGFKLKRRRFKVQLLFL